MTHSNKQATGAQYNYKLLLLSMLLMQGVQTDGVDVMVNEAEQKLHLFVQRDEFCRPRQACLRLILFKTLDAKYQQQTPSTNLQQLSVRSHFCAEL